MSLFILFESASGYALFERLESEEIGELSDQAQASFQDFQKFSKVMKLKSFVPFSSSEAALENINDVSEGVLNPLLKEFLQTNFSKVKSGKKSSYVLGVSEEKLGSVIQENLGITCQKSLAVLELVRAIRLHFEKFIKELKEGDLVKAQRGLGHGYSRAKVKFNIHKVDNMIIQSISLLDQLDKDLNTFSMRCREWYSWHFPELVALVSENAKYAQLCKFIQDKSSLTEESLGGLEEIVNDREKAQQILDAARASMGTDISPVDMINIQRFADRVVGLTKYRAKLHEYLLTKMGAVAPNLSALVGEQVAARLIAHAGSLTNLAKYPASTVQILGAEKALFRALKTRGNTPKYGLIFHSSFIGRASAKNKGRISRYLANKCSIAARIDSFSDLTTAKFGEKLKEQVEERLKFYDTGETPKKNVDAMKEVIEDIKSTVVPAPAEETPKKKKKDKKRKHKEAEEKEEKEEVEEEGKEETRKKKKQKKSQTPSKSVEETETASPASSESKKKKKKKNGEEMEVEASSPATGESKKKKKKKKATSEE